MDGDLRDLLSGIRADIAEMQITLAKQSVILEEHIRRTTVSEERLDILQREVEPLKMHVAVWGVLGKILAGLATIGGLVLTVMKLLGK